MFRKVFKNLDFIECLVKLAHIKSRSYIQGVAKISQNENKIATFPITINYRKITNDNA